MRAQVSFEFILVYSALLLLFVVVFFIYLGGTLNLAQAQDAVLAGRNARAAAAAINYVYLAGPGAAYNFTPSGVAADENVTVSDFGVTSWRPKASRAAPVLDGNINVSELGRGSMLIENEGGEILVTD
jgi:hypothetical protein